MRTSQKKTCSLTYSEIVYNLISRRFGLPTQNEAKACDAEILVSTRNVIDSIQKSRNRNVNQIRIYVGTQTGTADDYATCIHTHIRHTWPSMESKIERIDLVDVNPFAHCDKGDLHIFVVSTYGNGEPPENSRAFWTQLTDATVNDVWLNRQILVVGLGHSGFPKYCQFGKDLYAKLVSLGALPIADFIAMDALQGPDEDYLIACVNTALKPILATENPAKNIKGLGKFSFILLDNSSNLTSNFRKATISDSFTIDHVIKLDEEDAIDNGGRTYEVLVSVNQNDINANICQLYAGGAVGFYPPISNEDTDELLDAYEWVSETGEKIAGRELGKKYVYSNDPNVLGRSIPDGICVKDLFQSFIDFEATEQNLGFYKDVLPKNHPLSQDLLKGQHEWLEQNIIKPCVSVKEFIYKAREIEDFRIPFEMVFVIPRVKLRQYSIASTLMNASEDRKSFKLIVSRSTCERPVNSLFSKQTDLIGRMTSVLDCLATTCDKPLTIWGCGSASQIRSSHWRESGLWIATGSGIAPFLGLISARKENNYIAKKPTVLIYGCRSSSLRDFVGREQLIEAVRANILDEVFVTFSREEDPKMKLVHASHASGKLEPLVDSFEEGQNAYVYNVIKRIGDSHLKDILLSIVENKALAILCGSLRMSGPTLKAMTDVIASKQHISQMVDNEHLILELW